MTSLANTKWLEKTNISQENPGYSPGHKNVRWLLCIMWGYIQILSQTVKHLPAMQETQVCSLGWDDPLEKEMATHSSILAWKIPWTEDPGGLQSMELQRVGRDWATEHVTMRHELFRVHNVPWKKQQYLSIGGLLTERLIQSQCFKTTQRKVTMAAVPEVSCL